MGKFRGTQGKWILEKHNHPLGGYLLLDSKGYQIGIIDNEYVKNEKEFEANAKLIAAAPEMLEALINIEDYVNRSLTLSGHSKKDIEIILSKVRTSIKKATE